MNEEKKSVCRAEKRDAARAYMERCTAVVLCGGRSSRMNGRAKHLLRAGDATFLERLVCRLAGFGSVALSVNSPSQITGVSLPLWCDEAEGIGPLEGLRVALSRSETPWVFATPCDVPDLDEALLLELFGRLRDDDLCLVPSTGGAVQPLTAIYSRRCLPALTEVLERGERSVRAFLRAVSARYAELGAEWRGRFVNINTPAEYERWLSERRGVVKEIAMERKKPSIPVYSFVAWSGAGKTTFLEKLLPELKRRGLRVAVVKHDAHDFDIDREGKDTWRLTRAGADVTAIASARRAAIMENRPVAIDELLSRVANVDVILAEGFKDAPWRKIGIVRAAAGKGLPPGEYAAVVADAPMKTKNCAPVFPLDDAPGVAEWLLRDMGLGGVPFEEKE